MIESERAETYWAKEQDPEVLTGKLRDLMDSFSDSLEENRLLYVLVKNWRFYHGMFFGGTQEAFQSGVRFLGLEGEYLGLPDNEYRSLLQHLLTLVTENRPSFKCVATNANHTSLESARIGDDLLKYYFKDLNVEEKADSAAEKALILLRGFVKVCWDPNAGRPIAGSEAGFLYEGDLRVTTPSVFDVFYDLSHQDWESVMKHWVIVREPVNRWDLIAIHPEWEEELLHAPNISDDNDRKEMRWDVVSRINKSDSNDLIYRYELLHALTPAVPVGRCVQFVGKAILKDEPLNYDGIPIFSCSPAEMMLTTFGYSPALDLVGLQEALNQELATILTNHKSFGIQSIWCKSAADIQASQLKEGLTLVESEEEPKPLQLTATPTEILEFPATIRQSMEYKSGINSVARGQPEASLKSGSALALIDSKAAQLAGGFKKRFYLMLEKVAHCMLKTVQRYATTERIVSIVGDRNRQYELSFKGEDLAGIDRVQIETQSYLLQTPAGRLDAANNMLNAGIVKTPAEYLTVLTTGNAEPLYQADHAQLALIHDENERLVRGENVEAAITDNHILHVREHMAQIASVNLRADQVISGNVMAHCMTHLQMVADPEAQMWGLALGYQESLQMASAMAPAGGEQTGSAPGGSKPGDANTPNEAPDQSGIGDTTPREPKEPGGSPQMPNMPGVPMAPGR